MQIENFLKCIDKLNEWIGTVATQCTIESSLSQQACPAPAKRIAITVIKFSIHLK